jgi:cytochrome P450
VAESGYAAERAALARVLERLGPAVDLVADAPGNHGLFGRIVAAWSDVPADERRRGAALDVVLVHVASMSNLNAALGWVLVDLLEHPDALDRVRGGDEAFASRCALESTRLAQRSIMSRHVLQPVSVDTGATTYDVGAGVTVATLLPLTNLDPALGHDRWDPERWDRHRFTDTAGRGSPQLVTAFGHGRHTCPAQPFSLAAMRTAARRLLAAYDLVPRWTAHPRPVPAQIGGVARAAEPCLVDYRTRRGD